MKFVLNSVYSNEIRKAWDRFIQKKIDDNQHIKNYKAPSKPGPGWLAGQAAHLEICGATGLWQGEYVCCGNILDTVYYCSTHQKLYEKQNKIASKEVDF